MLSNKKIIDSNKITKVLLDKLIEPLIELGQRRFQYASFIVPQVNYSLTYIEKIANTDMKANSILYKECSPILFDLNKFCFKSSLR